VRTADASHDIHRPAVVIEKVFKTGKGEKSAVPINRRKPQSPPLHFIAKFVGVLLHAVTRKAIFATKLACRIAS
jgi:hypothetical protein